MASDSNFLRGVLWTTLVLPALAWAHGGPGFYPAPQRAVPPAVTGLPPTYIAPGQLPPTYIPPGQLPPWAYQPAPSSGFSIPPDPSLSHRNLLNEEMRLRGWQQDPWRDRPGHEHGDGRRWREDRKDGNGGNDGDDGHRMRRGFDNR